MTHELATTTHAQPPARSGAFDSLDAFASAQRMAGLLASSTMVPKEYQGNLSNCVIALEIAARLATSPFMVMQNLNVIHGRPAWSAAFVIASVEASGKFGPLHYEWRGDDACRCVARDLRSGEDLAGTWITREMVTKEGWASKTGSKWASMPEQMFRYRAASFWARAYAPGILMGMTTADEAVETIDDARPQAVAVVTPSPAVLDAPADKPKRGLRAAMVAQPVDVQATDSGVSTPDAPLDPWLEAAAWMDTRGLSRSQQASIRGRAQGAINAGMTPLEAVQALVDETQQAQG